MNAYLSSLGQTICSCCRSHDCKSYTDQETTALSSGVAASRLHTSAHVGGRLFVLRATSKRARQKNMYVASPGILALAHIGAVLRRPEARRARVRAAFAARAVAAEGAGEVADAPRRADGDRRTPPEEAVRPAPGRWAALAAVGSDRGLRDMADVGDGDAQLPAPAAPTASTSAVCNGAEASQHRSPRIRYQAHAVSSTGSAHISIPAVRPLEPSECMPGRVEVSAAIAVAMCSRPA